jgi:hypothetical protein
MKLLVAGYSSKWYNQLVVKDQKGLSGWEREMKSKSILRTIALSLIVSSAIFGHTLAGVAGHGVDPATGEAYTVGPASPAYTLGWGYDGTGWYYRTGEADFIIGDFLTDDVYTYYMDNTGHMVTGWQNIKGFKYYFYTEADTNNTTGAPTGSMAKSQTIDNIELDADGKAKMNGTSDEAIAAVQATGGTLRGAYNYAASLKYRRFTADPNSGTRYFAHLGFSMGNGNCYVMAAVFCEMARALGYEVRQIAGSVPLRRGGMGPHSWCEVNIDGTWRVFDPNFTNETGRDGYNIYYGKSGTWRYSSYSAMHD